MAELSNAQDVLEIKGFESSKHWFSEFLDVFFENNYKNNIIK